MVGHTSAIAFPRSTGRALHLLPRPVPPLFSVNQTLTQNARRVVPWFFTCKGFSHSLVMTTLASLRTMSRPRLVLSESFDDAREFVQALHPLNERWESMPGGWIYRGHWDAGWKLVPSLYRSDRIQPFLALDESFEEVVGRAAYGEIEVMEMLLLGRVLDEFDRAGLPIPEMQEVRQLLKNVPFDIRDGLIPFVALAQHHGVPTRLIDWTTQARVAAYFAAADITKGLPNLAERYIEVIAMDRDAVQFANNASVDDFCRLVHAPRASNANLHAQSGLFTVCHGPEPALGSLDEILLACIANSPITRTVFGRMTLPQARAGELLHYLSHQGITGATMFPGYDGTVRKFRETKFYSTPIAGT
jgi:FRG domain